MADTDLLVVGGGTAGCVVAARCSASLDVVVLEAGPALDADSLAVMRGPNFHAAYGLPDRHWTTGYATGRGVGGSSMVNAMVARFGDDDTGSALERSVAAPHEWGPLAGALLAAAPDHGLVAHPLELTRTAGGQRSSVVDAFLEPALRSGRLTVETDSLVECLLRSGRSVIGVRLADGREITARRTVLAAGATRSPAVLLRSGIDLPGVGRGLQDHPAYVIPLAYRRPLDDAAVRRTVSVAVGASGPGNLRLLAADAVTAGSAGLLVMLLAPVSNGIVRLDAADPLGQPVVDLAFLADPRDREAMDTGLAVADALLDDRRLTEVVDRAGPPSAGGVFHACGGCRMGPATDPLTVVDAAGNVHGVDGLSVCDASVLPGVPVGSVHVAVIEVAQRVADAIVRATTGA